MSNHPKRLGVLTGKEGGWSGEGGGGLTSSFRSGWAVCIARIAFPSVRYWTSAKKDGGIIRRHCIDK
jgi:hypothetical protein